MESENFNLRKYLELLEKSQKDLWKPDDAKLFQFTELREIAFEQFCFYNRNKYLDLVVGCMDGTIGLANASFVLSEINAEISCQFADFEKNVQALKDFQFDPKAKNFSIIDLELFRLFSFFPDSCYGFDEKYILGHLPKIRQQILTYD